MKTALGKTFEEIQAANKERFKKEEKLVWPKHLRMDGAPNKKPTPKPRPKIPESSCSKIKPYSRLEEILENISESASELKEYFIEADKIDKKNCNCFLSKFSNYFRKYCQDVKPDSLTISAIDNFFNYLKYEEENKKNV